MGTHKGNTIFMFVGGLFAGVVAGILFAPDKGRNTRDKISYQLDKYAEALQELLDRLMEEKDFVDNEAREEGEKVISEIKNKANRIMEEVEALKKRIGK